MRFSILGCVALSFMVGCMDPPVAPRSITKGVRANRSASANGARMGLTGWPNEAPEVVNSLADLAPGWYRLTIFWSRVEPTPGERYQPYLDELHSTLNHLKDAGISPYLVFNGSPAWTRGCADGENGEELADHSGPCPTNPSSPPGNEYIVSWQQFVASMVNEFGPNSGQYSTVTYFGVFNEPNDAGQFVVSPGEDPMQRYSYLVNYAAPEIKARGGLVVAPELGPGVDYRRANPSPEQWLMDYMSQGAGWTTDVLAIHIYAGSGEASDAYPTPLSAIRRHLEDNPMWPYGNWRFWVTESATGDPVFFQNEDNQARWVVRTYNDFFNYRASHPSTRWDALFYFQHFERPYRGPGDNRDYLLQLMDYESGVTHFKDAYYCYRLITHGLPPSWLNPPGCSHDYY